MEQAFADCAAGIVPAPAAPYSADAAEQIERQAVQAACIAFSVEELRRTRSEGSQPLFCGAAPSPSSSPRNGGGCGGGNDIRQDGWLFLSGSNGPDSSPDSACSNGSSGGGSSDSCGGSTIAALRSCGFKRRRAGTGSPATHPTPQPSPSPSPHFGAAAQLAPPIHTGRSQPSSGAADVAASGPSSSSYNYDSGGISARLSVATEVDGEVHKEVDPFVLENKRIVQKLRSLEAMVAHLPPFDTDNLSMRELQEVYRHLRAVTEELGPWRCSMAMKDEVLAGLTPPFTVWNTPVNHACSDGGCPYLYNYRSMYICLLSGMMHMCTQYTCNLAVQTVECKACPLTCQSFPLDFTWSWEDGQKSNAYKAQVNTRAIGGTSKQHHRVRRVAADDKVACTSRYTGVHQDRIEEFAKFVQMFLTLKPLTRERRVELAKEILDLFVQYLKLCSPPTAYSEEFHTYLMLRLMAFGGCHFAGKCYVKSHPDVTEAMDSDEATMLLRLRRTPNFFTHQSTEFQRIHQKAIRDSIAAEAVKKHEDATKVAAKAEAIAKAEALYAKQKALPATSSLFLNL
jgi:hypothetical protein